MKKIIPITDLQRQSRRIVGGLSETGEPVIITQRGRAAAVLLSAERYSQIEEDLNRLDELEMLNLLERGMADFDEGRTLSSKAARARLEKRYSTPNLRKSRRGQTAG
jgi:prevent-host-death family protein